MKPEVELRSSHLILPSTISKQVFEEDKTAYVSYQKESNALLVSPKRNSWFPKLHKSYEFILKTKDLVGTKSISIQEILIDHEIDNGDRKLACEINQQKQFLKIDMTLK